MSIKQFEITIITLFVFSVRVTGDTKIYQYFQRVASIHREHILISYVVLGHQLNTNG